MKGQISIHGDIVNSLHEKWNAEANNIIDASKPWMKYAGMVKSGNVRSSQEIDCIIYGHKI